MAIINKMYIGSSDYSRLILAGNKELKYLSFGRDGAYSAKVIYDSPQEWDTLIPPHYKKVACFEGWLKIYDDDSLVCEIRGDLITVYRAGEMGCIIHSVGIINLLKGGS